jgi:hypothetical protein
MSGSEGYTGVSCGNVKGVKIRVFMRDSVINQQVPSGAPLAFQTDYAGSIPVIPSIPRRFHARTRAKRDFGVHGDVSNSSV